MTEKQCYIKIYGTLFQYVPHYRKIDMSPGAVNIITKEEIAALEIFIPVFDN